MAGSYLVEAIRAKVRNKRKLHPTWNDYRLMDEYNYYEQLSYPELCNDLNTLLLEYEDYSEQLVDYRVMACLGCLAETIFFKTAPSNCNQ
jgi:hypothetical protein